MEGISRCSGHTCGSMKNEDTGGSTQSLPLQSTLKFAVAPRPKFETTDQKHISKQRATTVDTKSPA